MNGKTYRFVFTQVSKSTNAVPFVSVATKLWNVEWAVIYEFWLPEWSFFFGGYQLSFWNVIFEWTNQCDAVFSHIIRCPKSKECCQHFHGGFILADFNTITMLKERRWIFCLQLLFFFFFLLLLSLKTFQ